MTEASEVPPEVVLDRVAQLVDTLAEHVARLKQEMAILRREMEQRDDR